MIEWPGRATRRRLKAIRDEIGSLREAIQTLAVASNDYWQATSQARDAQHRDTGERLEFVRREILYEFQHGGRRPYLVEWRPLRASALHDPDGVVRLNLGCGHKPMPGYVNVDARELPGVDVIADVADLRLPVGSVHEIYSAHLLEHFPHEELRRRLLPHWRDLLAEGGVFHAIVPDGEAMIAAAARGELSFEAFREVLFGGQDYRGDYHFNMFTPDSLLELLTTLGFKDITIVDRARRNGLCFEFEISARK